MKNNVEIKSTNVLMPRWSCRGRVHTECITIHDCWQLLTCMQVTVAFNAAKLYIGVLKKNSGSRLCTQKS